MAGNSHVYVLAGVLLGVFAGSALAQDQEPQRRSFQRVFGAEPVAVGPNELIIDLTASQTFDDNILAGRLTTADPRLGEGGGYPSGGANISFAHTGQRTTFTTSGSTAFQHYPSLDDRIDHNHAASIGVNHTLGRRTTLQVSQSAAYSTYYTLLGVPGALSPAIPGAAAALPPTPVIGGSSGVASEPATELHSFVALERQMGRRNSFSSHYALGWTRFAARQTQVHDVGFGYRHGLGRSLALRTGYGLQSGTRHATDDRLLLHNLDFGVDYNRSLPGLRNTTLSVSSGSSVLQLQTGLRYGLRASASLTHLMARSWTASLTYDRGAEFVGVLGDLLQSDSVGATLSGFASPRAEITLLANYAMGHLGTRQEAETRTYNGTARMQFGLSRRFALNTEYQYFLYDFAEAATIPQGLPFGESRHSLRFGVLYRFIR